MNFASWVILAVVVAILALAIKGTFFKKRSRGGCCDKGDEPLDIRIDMAGCGYSKTGGCEGCTACSGAVARNNVQPVYKLAEDTPNASPTKEG